MKKTLAEIDQLSFNLLTLKWELFLSINNEQVRVDIKQDEADNIIHNVKLSNIDISIDNKAQIVYYIPNF